LVATGRVVLDPTEQRPQPGEKFVEGERLGQVVVGSGIEAFDPVTGGGAGGEHQNGETEVFGASHPTHCESVEYRHADVENHGVKVAVTNRLERLAAVPGGRHGVVLKAQGAFQRATHRRIVVSDKDLRHVRLWVTLPGTLHHTFSLPEVGKKAV
jgi:hypothetical protein